MKRDDLAALLHALENPPLPDTADASGDLTELLDALESVDSAAELEAELEANNKERERIIRKHYGNRR